MTGARKYMLLNDQTLASLRSYRYAGGDLSYVYKYFSSPLAEFCVQHFVPRWLAPNVITLTGLMFPIMSFILMAYYAPGFAGSPPAWAYVFCAAALFTYSLLDNMDGKQARRTGSGSPLGMLFDHGCDAMNTTISTITFAAGVQFGVLGPVGGYYAFVYWVVTASLFFFATWEEYHIGALYLPVVNGPTEGIIITEICFILTAINGPMWWYDKHFYTLSLAVAGLVGTALLQMYNVHKDAAAHGKSHVAPYRRMAGFVTFMALACLWVSISSVPLYHHPRATLLLFGAILAEIVTRLMLAHILHDEYRPPWHTILPLTLAVANAAGFWVLSEPLVPEGFVVYAYLAYAATSLFSFCLRVIDEICDALDISCFRIRTKGQ